MLEPCWNPWILSLSCQICCATWVCCGSWSILAEDCWDIFGPTTAHATVVWAIDKYLPPVCLPRPSLWHSNSSCCIDKIMVRSFSTTTTCTNYLQCAIKPINAIKMRVLNSESAGLVEIIMHHLKALLATFELRQNTRTGEGKNKD